MGSEGKRDRSGVSSLDSVSCSLAAHGIISFPPDIHDHGHGHYHAEHTYHTIALRVSRTPTKTETARNPSVPLRRKVEHEIGLCERLRETTKK